jgi:hypothetical protein
MTDAETKSLLLEVIRADVRSRVDTIVDRLEAEVDCLERLDDVEHAMRGALIEVTEVLAEGIAAHLRETRR